MGTTNRNSHKPSAARANLKGKFDYENIASQHSRPSSGLSLLKLLLWLLGGIALLVIVVELRRPARPTKPNLTPQVSDTAPDATQARDVASAPAERLHHESTVPSQTQSMARPMTVPQAAKADDPAASDHSVKVTLTRDRGGNYVGTGMINRKTVKLLVDTGASLVVIPEGIARQIGLKKGQAMNFKTAGGLTTHYATVLETLTIGPIQINQVAAAINPAMQEDFVLLGMNALELLRFSQEEGKLVLSYDPDKATGTAHEVDAEEPAPFRRSLEECGGATRTYDQRTLSCLQGH